MAINPNFCWGDTKPKDIPPEEPMFTPKALILAGEHAGNEIEYTGREIVILMSQVKTEDRGYTPLDSIELFAYRRFVLEMDYETWYYYVPDSWPKDEYQLMALEYINNLVRNQNG